MRKETFFHSPPPGLAVNLAEAHVFRLNLQADEGERQALSLLLDETERARAARYLFAADRERFAIAHGLARRVLGFITQQPPGALRLAVSEHGKPYLPDLPSLRFNLSHSRDQALLAFVQNQDVGVDIEAIRADLDRASIGRRFFSEMEWHALNALPAEDQISAFYTCWTRKEAYIKGRGLGMRIPINRFSVSLAPGEPARLLEPDPALPPGESWSLYDLQPGQGFAGALAVCGTVERVFTWQWG